MMISDKLLGKIWDKAVIVSDVECWTWKGQTKNGVAVFSTLAKHGLSSNVAKAVYQAKKGVIPDNMIVEHSCKNKSCINPSHLILVAVLTTDERFLSKIDKTPGLGIGDCWDWLGCLFDDGYGAFVPEHGKTVRAHRYAYELFKGAIPKGMQILHSCDRPICLNPDHLSTGTNFDNMQDMISKTRGMHGEKCHLAKLTADDVIKIRELLKERIMTQVAIARLYNVTPASISDIKKGKSWKHIK